MFTLLFFAFLPLLCIPSSSFFFFVSFLFTGFAWLKSHLVPDYTHEKKYAEFAFLFCIHWGINFSICHLYFTGDLCCLKLYLALHFNFPALHCATRKAKRCRYSKGFPGGSDGVESTCNVGDLGSNPGLGGSPGGGHGNPLQYSCLEKPHKTSDTAEQLAHIGRAPSKYRRLPPDLAGLSPPHRWKGLEWGSSMSHYYWHTLRKTPVQPSPCCSLWPRSWITVFRTHIQEFCVKMQHQFAYKQKEGQTLKKPKNKKQLWSKNRRMDLI